MHIGNYIISAEDYIISLGDYIISLGFTLYQQRLHHSHKHCVIAVDVRRHETPGCDMPGAVGIPA